MKMMTTTDENEARSLMVSRNRTRVNADPAVMVDGPGDGEFTVMDLRDAVEGGFAYRWEV